MMKHVFVLVTCAVLGAACGLPGLDALEGEADVEIVNAEASNLTPDGGADQDADDEVAGLGSATVDPDDATENGDGEKDSAESDAEEVTPTAQNERGVIETASGISLVGTEDRMSLSAGSPEGGWGYLTVHDAYAASSIEGEAPGPDAKFVLVDYQILGAQRDNFFDDAFRLNVGAESYSPINNINEILTAGSVFNGTLVFEVPLPATELQLEGGAIAGSADGFTSAVDFSLTPGAGDTPTAAPLSDDEVEAIVGDIQLTSSDTSMSIDTEQPSGGWGNLTVDAGRATAKIDENSAGPDFKFLIIDFQLVGVERDNFFSNALRLETGGELYGPLGSINEIITAGQVYNGSIIFRVPRDAQDFVLEGGMPERWADGLRTTYGFSLWDPAEGVEAEEQVASVDVEAEATNITLVGTETRMTMDPGGPRGFGTLTVDRAYTTAKIEQDGAREGFKYLLVEYQLLGVERDNFFDSAFRVEADGELYSPLNNINEIITGGMVFNGSLIFEVPVDVATVRLEGGVVQGSADGFTASYEITFG